MLATTYYTITSSSVIYNLNMFNTSIIKQETSFSRRQEAHRLPNDNLRLLAFDMNFINLFVEANPLIIYIGVGNSEYLLKLIMMYEFIEFHVYDTVLPLNLIKFLNEHPNQGKTINHYPTDEELQAYSSELNRVYLISNYTDDKIRFKPDFTTISPLEKQQQKAAFSNLKEQLLIEDAKINIHFAQILNPKLAMLKFRPPHIKDENVPSTFSFFDGTLLFPIFSDRQSGESRLIVSNYTTFIDWDNIKYAKNIGYWNSNVRDSLAINPLTNNRTPLPGQLGNDFEISILFSIIRDFFIATGYEGITMNDIFNLYINFLISENDNKVHSVSLIPYNQQGFLLTVEWRKNLAKSTLEKKKHLIGGKVEPNEDPLYAACREFIEETYLLIDIDHFYDVIKTSNFTFFDVDTMTGKVLSQLNSTPNKVHRFYIVSINSITDQEIRNQILTLPATFTSKKREEGISSLFYWNGREALDNVSSLLNYFIKAPLSSYIKVIS